MIFYTDVNVLQMASSFVSLQEQYKKLIYE